MWISHFPLQDGLQKDSHLNPQNDNYLPLVLSRGQGVWVWDIEGRRYLDMSSSYSAANYGHCHPKILGTLLQQAGRLSLNSGRLYHDQSSLFLETLCKLFDMDKGLITNSDEEALGKALEAVKKWGHIEKEIPLERIEIIVTSQNFQNFPFALTDFFEDESERMNFKFHLPHIKVIPFGNKQALEKAFTPYTCAVITETIQSEKGVFLPPQGWLSKINKLCKENNALLIINEVQTALGRCGKLLSCQYEEVDPDGIILGRALGGGFLSAGGLLGKGCFSETLKSYKHHDNALLAAVGLSSLQVIQEENLVERSAELGEYLLNRLRHIDSPFIQDIRGQGLWIGIEVDPNWRSAFSVCQQLMHMGILVRAETKNVICLAPPLVITHEEIDWALLRIYQVLQGSGTMPMQVPLAF